VSRVGACLLRAYPRPMRRTRIAWAKCTDIWKRRAAIISQVTFKRDTDLALLDECIRPSLGRTEFWLRKAIGWALRQYAWTDPTWGHPLGRVARRRAEWSQPTRGAQEHLAHAPRSNGAAVFACSPDRSRLSVGAWAREDADVPRAP